MKLAHNIGNQKLMPILLTSVRLTVYQENINLSLNIRNYISNSRYIWINLNGQDRIYLNYDQHVKK